ncbi:MAG: cyclopropane-fatty-acyl-phospholipid synthase family protein [Gammaproteobacteria bacterium]|nr:cyclopropane-fatty-acyl-phospholipid synthase family protein [Gammaproteobacteria bacterium]
MPGSRATPIDARRSARSRRVTALDRLLVTRLVKAIGNPPIAFALWDGVDVYSPQPRERMVGRVIFHDRGALIGSIASPELGFGDAYSAGRLDIEGDLVEVLFAAYRSMAEGGPTAGKRNLFGRLPKPRVNSLSRSKEHIHHHYDLGNEFYRLWLDENMVYTCAYYPDAHADLERAQLEKMHHVARKVRLEPGMRVVEAGCGWGALAMHMAEHYGVQVTAYNISHQQIVYAREKARERGLSERVEFVEDDYRNIDGQFDAFVSVGMLEHVGKGNYQTLGDVIHRSLKKGGLGLVHSVGRSVAAPPNGWLEQRIFPGSYPPSLREMLAIFEPHEFSVVDVENLRLHYAKTLMEWMRRFDNHEKAIVRMYDEYFVRAWRLYLGGCAAAFLESSIQLFQVVFAHRDDNRIPMTRRHVYGETGPSWEL